MFICKYHKELEIWHIFSEKTLSDSYSAILRSYGMTSTVQVPLMSLKVEQSKSATRVFLPVLKGIKEKSIRIRLLGAKS